MCTGLSSQRQATTRLEGLKAYKCLGCVRMAETAPTDSIKSHSIFRVAAPPCLARVVFCIGSP